MGGLWYNVRMHDLTIRKTKAHMSYKQAQEEGDTEDWTGNDLADKLAKEAAQYGTPSPEVIETREMDFLRRVQFYHLTASTLCLWKALTPSGQGHKTKKKTAAAVTTPHSLVWLLFLHKWTCTICLRHFRKGTDSRQRTCKGLPKKKFWRHNRARIVGQATAAGHKLMVCRYIHQPGSLLFCNSCGCHAEVRAKGLLTKCLGHQHTQRYLLTKYIQQGQHPQTKAPLGKPRRVPGIEDLPFTGAETTHEEGGREKPGTAPAVVTAKPAGQIPTVRAADQESDEDDAHEAFRLQEEDPDDESGFWGHDEE